MLSIDVNIHIDNNNNNSNNNDNIIGMNLTPDDAPSTTYSLVYSPITPHPVSTPFQDQDN